MATMTTEIGKTVEINRFECKINGVKYELTQEIMLDNRNKRVSIDKLITDENGDYFTYVNVFSSEGEEVMRQFHNYKNGF